MLFRFWFFKTLSNKISFALILNRKPYIFCQKFCIAYFRRHMECAVLKRFLKVQGTFLKKFLQIPLFPLEKINLIRFIKTLIKGFIPHPLRFAQHLLHGRRQTPQSLCDSSPFHGSLPKSKAVPERKGGKPKVWRKALKASQMDFRKTQWNCVLIKVFVQFLGNRKDKCGERSSFSQSENSWPRKLVGY